MSPGTEQQINEQRAKMAALDPKAAPGAAKPPLWLIPPIAKRAAAHVHALGAANYGPWNWRTTKVCRSTYISAIHRHLDAWQEGEELDPESNQSHLAHIIATCNILLDAQHYGTLVDDRPGSLREWESGKVGKFASERGKVEDQDQGEAHSDAPPFTAPPTILHNHAHNCAYLTNPKAACNCNGGTWVRGRRGPRQLGEYDS